LRTVCGLPTALTEAGSPLAGVRHLPLRGLNRADARDLWTRLGIHWTNEAALDTFFEQIGRHGLLPSAPLYCTTRPDGDKLLRAVGECPWPVAWVIGR
jgi:hypothetical protein